MGIDFTFTPTKAPPPPFSRIRPLARLNSLSRLVDSPHHSAEFTPPKLSRIPIVHIDRPTEFTSPNRIHELSIVPLPLLLTPLLHAARISSRVKDRKFELVGEPRHDLLCHRQTFSVDAPSVIVPCYPTPLPRRRPSSRHHPGLCPHPLPVAPVPLADLLPRQVRSPIARAGPTPPLVLCFCPRSRSHRGEPIYSALFSAGPSYAPTLSYSSPTG